MLSYLVNITRDGKHVALASSHDGEFVAQLTRALATIGCRAEVSASPSPLNGTTSK
jgi:hypothetical protein